MGQLPSSKISIVNLYRKFKLLIHKYPFLTIGIGLMVVLVVIGVITTMVVKKTSTRVAIPTVPQVSNIVTSANSVLPAPAVSYADYQYKTNLPNIPAVLTVYLLKTNFSNQEVLNFSQKFGLSTTVSPNSEDSMMVTYNMSDINQRGILQFNKLTGSFIYQSYGIFIPNGYSLPPAASDSASLLANQTSTTPQPLAYQQATQEATTLTNQLGLGGDQLTCIHTYQQTQLPSVTFVECHRDFSSTGVSLINPAGILNMTETKALSTVQPGDVDSGFPDDPAIAAVTTKGVTENKAVNKARPNDFNTITIGLWPDGSIHSINSNLRWITSQTDQPTRTDTNNIVTPVEAEVLFKENKATLALTIPAGSGTVDFNKVYPNDQATGETLSVSDTKLVYLEKPEDQNQDLYTPYYLIRGTSQLQSGYTVRSIQLVPALTDQLNKELTLLPSQSSGKPEVAGVSTQLADNQNIHFNNYVPPIDNSKPVTPPVSNTTPTVPDKSGKNTTSTPVVTTTLTTLQDCKEITKDANKIVLNIPNYGVLTLVNFENDVTRNKLGLQPHIFLYNSSSFPVDNLQQVQDILFKQVEKQYEINVARSINDDVPFGAAMMPHKTVDDVKKLFMYINKGFSCPDNTYQGYYDPSSMNTAPIFACKVHSGFHLNVARADQVANDVAQQILKDDANDPHDNTNRAPAIVNLAQEQDLFPAGTVKYNFNWIFLDSFPEDSAIYGNITEATACYVTGVSPRIFIDTTQTQSLTVKPVSFSTYTDPTLENDSWHIISGPNEDIMSSNGVTRPSLYYEYNKSKVQFSTPKTGYVVERSDWQTIVKNISDSLGLNQKETDALVTEVQNALVGSNDTKYLKISLLDQQEVNQQLPLYFSVQPTTLDRIQLMITPLEEQVSITPPTTIPVKRTDFTVVELGAIVK